MHIIPSINLRTQLRNNLLALISLSVALAALGYNTWRNELSEQNRTQRQAGFEMLLHIAELQRITYLAHYDGDQRQGSPRKGWSAVMVLRDLAELLPPRASVRFEPLFQSWEHEWSGLGKHDQSVERIDAALDDLRSDVLKVLASLS